MRLAAEYREEAARCRSMAARETNARMRSTILQLARQFDELAYQHEHESDGTPARSDERGAPQ